MKLTNEQIQAILDGAPEGAIEHCLYDYGDSTYPLYLNCENQFYEIDEKVWVDMRLVDNYFHSRRRLTDLREILELRQEVERQQQRITELEAENRVLRDNLNSKPLNAKTSVAMESVSQTMVKAQPPKEQDDE